MTIAITIFALLSQLAPPDSLTLSLDAAIRRALDANPSLRAERAAAHAAAQLPRQASQAFLPTLQLDLQGVRTTDPVAVFGLKLRQGAFAPADFDMNALNNPAAYSGFTAAGSVQLPLLAPEGLFGYAAAKRAAGARAAAAARAAGAIRFFVTRTYWDAQLAAFQVEALDTALTAIRAHVRQAEAMYAQGLVTGLDARLARLKEAEFAVQRLAADAQAKNAVSALRALLALPDSAPIVLTDSLPVAAGSTPCDSATGACDVSDRGDLAAYAKGAAAAGLVVKQAWASQLPAIAAFGSVAHHATGAPFGAGSADWTIGIGVSWRVLRGLAGPGAVSAANAEHDAAVARKEAAERQAVLEVLEATRLLEAARARAEVTAAAEREAVQALEHARLRYRTGAAPITELLDVQAAATAAVLSRYAARRDLLVALAALDFAYGVYDQ